MNPQWVGTILATPCRWTTRGALFDGALVASCGLARAVGRNERGDADSRDALRRRLRAALVVFMRATGPKDLGEGRAAYIRNILY